MAGSGEPIGNIEVVRGQRPQPTTPARVTQPQGREDTDERRVSMFIAYAKDLVVAGIVKPGTGSVQAVGNAVKTTAGELLRAFKELLADERGQTHSAPPPSKGVEAAATSGPAGPKSPSATPPPPAESGENELKNLEDYIDKTLKDQGFPKGIAMESVKKSRQNFLAEIDDPKMWAEKYVEDLIRYVGGTAKKQIVNGGLEFVQAK
jgi:hypothetical protein